MSESETPETERLEFEEALKRLSDIVARLEAEDIGLEESIKLFEEGSRLSRHCATILEQAELKVENVNEDKDQS